MGLIEEWKLKRMKTTSLWDKQILSGTPAIIVGSTALPGASKVCESGVYQELAQ